jgi:hypothetical protein
MIPGVHRSVYWFASNEVSKAIIIKYNSLEDPTVFVLVWVQYLVFSREGCSIA